MDTESTRVSFRAFASLFPAWQDRRTRTNVGIRKMGMWCTGQGNLCCSYESHPLPNPKSIARQPTISISLCQTKNKARLVFPTNLTKRTLSISILLGLPSISYFNAVLPPSISAETVQEQLERYTDEKEGFTLLRPSSWIKVEKPGATILFEEPGSRANNVGIVVNPVRISSLKDFGSPQDVAQKLIQAEKRKESTTYAQVIQVEERQGDGGLPVYQFEYKVDSSRGGIKRIFSAAFVASKKLYLLNIAYSDRPENPIDFKTRMMLEQVLHSFNLAT